MSDTPTQLNDDLATSFVNLEKQFTEKRSGQVDRREPDSSRNFRREVEREYRAEIRQLREESSEKALEISELRSEIAGIHAFLKTQEPTLNAATMIVNAGLVFRYMIITIVGVTAAIGGVVATANAVKAWMNHS